MSSRRVTCVLPAFDAAPTIGAVIRGVRAALPGAIIVVVDDGSTDGTADLSRPLADTTVRFDQNRGKGAALRAGFETALAHGCDALVTIDADGQHDPRYARDLVAALDMADLAIGARQRTAAEMPLGRRITNRLSASAVGWCIGQPVADAQSGFRALRATVACDVRPRGDRYEFETEFLILAGRGGYRVAFVPIPTSYPRLVPSRFRPVRDSARVVATIWSYSRGARA